MSKTAITSRTTYGQGLVFGLLSCTAWGVFPIYWKLLSDVPAMNVLAHRIIWSFAVLVLWQLLARNRTILSYLRKSKLLLMLALSGAIISLNWGTYIYAVETNHIVEAGLGYYISPLITVFMGSVFLREKLSIQQKIAVSLALVGATILAINYGKVPWIAMTLAMTFSAYGLIKKKLNLQSMPALTIETMMIVPLALCYLLWWSGGEGSFFPPDNILVLLLVLGGVVTSVPLFWFGKSTESVPLSTIGFLQYISPTLQVAVGVLLYKEDFDTMHLFCFSLVWIGLAFSTYDVIKKARSSI